ncbi:uncharacterized protein A1O9_10421 [Exophiala aquamarina CBS 119918]|uniref:Uncharacterized protein n=1 Tax=Exophiala aquamarina CBS 119918 TaxID=1182545 RepID=A0A072P0S5_9EURO|nr:uncharacterized protein A1O9_10421 [Exophiala aquamarina CBS 119918]KEF53446.1 hypothetical protein A1O9_10421 [Exophiala aquamarina CBS 119918]
MRDLDSGGNERSQDPERSIAIAADLETSAWTRFDHMVSTGKITYGATAGETLEDEGFKFELRLAPALQKKPITKADAPERKKPTGKNPFLDPNPDEILSSVGKYHTLLLNIYAFYRPSVLLITKDFIPQDDPLDNRDLIAAWAVLQNFSREQYFMIYNCGYNSGSSQGHKHMQLWPYPNEKELGFELFPKKAQSETVVSKDIPTVPLKHFVLRLPPHANAAAVIDAHRRLLQEVRQIQQQAGSGPAHNVIITKDWICLIPRRHSGFERGVGINSAGVLGLAWAVNEDEKMAWLSIGAAELLRFVGIPVNA